MDFNKSIKPSVFLFILGFVGIVSIVPFIPNLLALQSAPLPLTVEMIQVVSVIQSSVLLLFLVGLGSVFSKKVGLSSPVIFALAHSENALKELKPQIIPAIIGGIVGGVFLLALLGTFSSYLPAEFLSAGEKLMPPWYTKLLYGGITEELLIRWGLMSFFVWGMYRLTQKSGSDIRSHNYILAILVSSLIFGLGHLPIAFALSPEITAPLVAYIILGNASFGFIAGYLYWKRGLECAIGAHMVAHLTMIVGANFA
ncbi:CPBP family intramembrane glutamic endopeptidase [Paraglaciecola sp. 25GB23A]|uniref:CPBP family intramembrane glutamic endopeptidase n=1 Tax=Paraglaciecola sp. 25GB23A TaxID=3156068 RepID=UPI0032AEE713